MNQVSTALNLFRVDIRWLFLLLVFAMIATPVALVLCFARVFDPAMLKIALFGVLCVSVLAGIQRIGLPYQLGLPISTRVLFLTALLLADVAIWIPTFSVVAVLVAVNRAGEIRMPLASGALWMAGYCVLWVGWTKRSSAPSAAILTVVAIEVAAVFRWLVDPPPFWLIAALLAFSAGAVFVITLRLPAVFEISYSERVEAPSSVSSGRTYSKRGADGWLALVQILLPWKSAILIFAVPVLLMQRGAWPLQGLWAALVYSQFPAKKHPLLLSLPISQVKLVYTRLICAGLLVGLASYLNFQGRLRAWRTGESVGGVESMLSELLAVTVALALIAAGKLLTWHRLRRWPKRMIALIPISLFIGSLAFSVRIQLTNQIVDSSSDRIAPVLFLAIGLLLWLIATETKEADQATRL